MRPEQFAETIVACSTPPGKAAVAVVRISGPETIRILETTTRFKGTVPWNLPRSMRVGRVDTADGESLDEVLAVFFPGPESYTGEDMAEIHCHGNDVVVDEVVAQLLSAGARPAMRGEFTRRALMAGKIDLARAEAVMRMVEAGSREQIIGALKSLGGSFSSLLERLQQGLQENLAHVEASIDFPDEPEIARLTVTSLAPLADKARTLRQGLRKVVDPGTEVVFAGRPNVGKSSLVNAVAGRQVSIVCEEPGTTRDAVSTGMILGGMRVTLVDTAGLSPELAEVRLQGGKADREAARVSRERIRGAGLVVWVTDRAHERPPQPTQAGQWIWVVNKCDLYEEEEKERMRRQVERDGGWLISAATGEGVDAWERAVQDILQRTYGPADGIPVTTRQRHAVDRLVDAIDRAEHRNKDACPELAAVDLREAMGAIEELLGSRVDDQVLDRIFEEFCIGK